MRRIVLACLLGFMIVTTGLVVGENLKSASDEGEETAMSENYGGPFRKWRQKWHNRRHRNKKEF